MSIPLSNRDHISEFIKKCYREILHREPDLEGFEFYYRKLQNKEILQKQLPSIFKESKEFIELSNKRHEFDINFFEKKIFSQNGEDGILEFIFSEIGTTNKFFVEIGVGDGIECNCRFLLENGWNGVMIDGSTQNSSHVKKEFVTSENIDNIFRKYAIPKSFDLLSLDVDYNTFWIWKAIQNYSPRVVVIEYNSAIPSDESCVVEYSSNAIWDGTNYFGASLLALSNLAKSKGYSLVGCESKGVNAFFIENSLVSGKIKRDIKQMYKPPGYGVISNGIHIGFPASDKTMMKI